MNTKYIVDGVRRGDQHPHIFTPFRLWDTLQDAQLWASNQMTRFMEWEDIEWWDSTEWANFGSEWVRGDESEWVRVTSVMMDAGLPQDGLPQDDDVLDVPSFLKPQAS